MTTPAPPLTEPCRACFEKERFNAPHCAEHCVCVDCEPRRLKARVAALESELAESTRERYAAIREMAKAREQRMDAQARGDLNAWFVHDWEEGREGLVKRLWDKSKALHARNVELESELARLRGPYGPMIEAADREANPFRVQDLTKRLEKAESELAQLRRGKAEREGLYRRTVALLDDGWSLYVGRGDDGTCEATLESVHVSHLGTGPTYEAALAAALSKLENT